LEKEREDRQRFDEESQQADMAKLAEQEARRKAQIIDEEELMNDEDGGRAVHKQRGARQRLDHEREEKERHRKQRRLELEAQMDPEVLEERRRIKEEKRRETEERQKERAAREKALAKQHAKLDKEQSKKAANRLEYLLKQSSIFGKLKMGGETHHHKDGGQPEVHHRPAEKDKSKGEGGAESVADEEELENEEETHVFLTQQPSSIKHGRLKAYQLESLNWMIHLAEKGLNGILADEVSRWQRIFRASCRRPVVSGVIDLVHSPNLTSHSLLKSLFLNAI
jgi:hypothetical protein